MKFGIVGPMSKDWVILPNGTRSQKFGAVIYTALALAKLIEGTDHKVVCLSHISAADSAEIFRLLKHPNINLAAISGSQQGTEIVLSYFDGQERTSRQKSVMNPMTAEEIHFIADCDYVLFMPLNDTDISLQFIQAFRKSSQAVIVFDVHGVITGLDEQGNRFKKYWAQAEEWLPNIDVIKMNDKEVSWASRSLPEGREDYIDYAVDKIKQGLTAYWITFGNQPSLVVWRRESRILWANVPVPHVAPVVDTIGCGDTASAGFMYSYAKMASPIIAVIMGNILGSVKASIHETSEFPTRPEVHGMISNYYYDYLHHLLDQLLFQNQLIIHEVKEGIDDESAMHIANEYRYHTGADHARGGHSQGSAKPWS